MNIMWQDSTLFSPEEVSSLCTDLQLKHSLPLIGWLLDILRALRVCIYAGAVHGDLKPENIMIKCNGEAALIDFGASQLLEPGSCSTEQGGGTSGYMAPEAFHGDTWRGNISSATDVFSFGILSGELIGSHVSKIFSALGPELFPELQRTLSSDPNLRPTVDELEAVFEGVQAKMLCYVPGGPGSLHDLVNMQLSEPAVDSCLMLEKLHTYVEVVRLSLVAALKMPDLPSGSDMQQAWLACKAVDVDSSQLFQLMCSVRFPIWDRENWPGEALPGVWDFLAEMDAGIEIVGL